MLSLNETSVKNEVAFQYIYAVRLIVFKNLISCSDWPWGNLTWMDKGDVVYMYTMEYYSAIKRLEILPFATTWMDFEGIMLSEISQTEKGKYLMISLICGITHTHTHTQNWAHGYKEQIGGCLVWRMGEMGEGGQRYKFPVITWISHGM